MKSKYTIWKEGTNAIDKILWRALLKRFAAPTHWQETLSIKYKG